MKFIKKHWLPLALVLFIIVLLGERSCRKSTYKEDIKESNERVTELEKINLEHEGEINKAIEDVRIYEEKVAKVEAKLKESEVIIEYLKKKRVTVVSMVMALPPSELVERSREILECAEIELTEEGILFSEDCTRRSLVIIEQFSLIKEELDETKFALSKSKEATQLQKIHTYTVYKIALGLTNQKVNYKKIIKEKDFQFDLCQKKKKGAWLDGLWKGFLIGVAVTATAKLIFGKLI